MCFKDPGRTKPSAELGSSSDLTRMPSWARIELDPSWKTEFDPSSEIRVPFELGSSSAELDPSSDLTRWPSWLRVEKPSSVRARSELKSELGSNSDFNSIRARIELGFNSVTELKSELEPSSSSAWGAHKLRWSFRVLMIEKKPEMFSLLNVWRESWG